MKKVLLTLFILLSIIFIRPVYAKDTVGKTGMYIWNISNVDYSSLDKTIDYLNIDTLYIGNYKDLESYEHTILFNYAKDKKIKIYMVYGEKIASIKDIKNLTDKVVTYNNSHSYKISGLAIDSEFHTTDEYRSGDIEKRKELFNTYVNTMKEAKSYINSKGLKLVSCIPVYYDDISIELLEELIKNGSDYVQIMNYNKNGKITKIENEVELARKYNKPIESIAELQQPGPNGVTESITFWNQGLDASTASFLEIKNHYNYNKMTFCYHAYSSVIVLAAKVLDFKSQYNLELYPKDKDGNSIKIDNVYLVNGNNKIKGYTIYHKTAKEYIIYFYGVNYTKEYTISVSGYDINNSKIKYETSDDITKYDERVFEVSKPTSQDKPSTNTNNSNKNTSTTNKNNNTNTKPSTNNTNNTNTKPSTNNTNNTTSTGTTISKEENIVKKKK